MRKIIIDTDTGSDDAIALLMALRQTAVEVLAVTTVAGNVPLELATQNALMTVETAQGQRPPVYVGAARPMNRELVTACNVHGKDGMGDQDLIHPTIEAQRGDAADMICDMVRVNPGGVEIVTIGPLTNIAYAIRKDADVMRQTKHIYCMGTSGFGRGNTTPYAEFNIYVDAEAFDIVMNAGIPVTIIGFDLCVREAALFEPDLAVLLNSGKQAAVFAAKCCTAVLDFKERKIGERRADLPDPLAMAVCLWDDVMTDSVQAFAEVCTDDTVRYGQVTMHTDGQENKNAVVCKRIDNALFKQRLTALLMV